jgi:spore coat protein A, manganese oxidase
MKKRLSIPSLALLTVFVVAGFLPAAAQQTQFLLEADKIPQFVDPLPVPGDITVIDAVANPNYSILMLEFPAQVLPTKATKLYPRGFPKTKVWGYRTLGDLCDSSRNTYVGPLVRAARGTAAKATYTNGLFFPTSDVQPLLPFDLTNHWANPLGIVCQSDPVTGAVLSSPPNPDGCNNLPSYLGPMPTAPHLHGGEIHPSADGGPDAWFTIDGRQGPGAKYNIFNGTTLTYPNKQEACTLWFHDHSLGNTRFGVFSGLAGMYIIKDPAKEPQGLPSGKYDLPLIIQDKSFDIDGQLFYNLASNPQPDPSIHPFWIPEFLGDVPPATEGDPPTLGDVIVVNGKSWPFLNVEQHKYRFRILNASQARFYNLSFSDPKVTFQVIATDGGYLKTPVKPSPQTLLIGPGERYEIVADFTKAAVGSQIILKNDANTPFPDGDPPNPTTNGKVMKFAVATKGPGDSSTVPSTLRPQGLIDLSKAIPKKAIKRQLTLNEIALEPGLGTDPGGPLRLVLNNTEYNKVAAGFEGFGLLGRNTEMPAVGDTEVWEVINISADAHPIHIHLIQFQVLSRQAISETYAADYDLISPKPGPGEGPPLNYLAPNGDGAIGGNPAVGPYLVPGTLTPPAAYEKGWKDTAIMPPGFVTRVAIRWAPLDTATNAVSAGINKYPFNPTELVNGKVGYAWHCHILEHEDNEMMRPYIVGTQRQIQIQ